MAATADDRSFPRSIPSWAPTAPTRQPRCPSRGESEAAAGAAEHQHFRYLLLGQGEEILAAVMHRQHMLEVERLELRHHPLEVIVRRRSEVEAANERVDLVNARDLPRAAQRVDDAGVTAGGDHHEPSIAEPE